MVNVTQTVLTRMIGQAIEAAPAECCALLGGRNGLFSSWYPVSNIADDPRRRYAADPHEMFAAMREMRARDETSLGIFHSHPTSPAEPSPTDIALAFYPEATYFIVSLFPSLHLRAFRILAGTVEAVELGCVRDGKIDGDIQKKNKGSI